MEARLRRIGTVGALTIGAITGEVESLSDHLLSEEPLSKQDRKWLAWFVGRQKQTIEELQPRRRGHPVGISPRQEAMHCVVHLVTTWKAVWRAKEHRERVPRSIASQFIRHALELVDKHFPEQRSKISVEEIEDLFKATRSKRSADFAKEFFPRAKLLTPELRRI